MAAWLVTGVDEKSHARNDERPPRVSAGSPRAPGAAEGRRDDGDEAGRTGDPSWRSGKRRPEGREPSPHRRGGRSREHGPALRGWRAEGEPRRPKVGEAGAILGAQRGTASARPAVTPAWAEAEGESSQAGAGFWWGRSELCRKHRRRGVERGPPPGRPGARDKGGEGRSREGISGKHRCS